MSTTTVTVTESAYEALLAQALALVPAERYTLTLALLDSLSAAVGAKGKRKAKAKAKTTTASDSEAEAKAPRAKTAWNLACSAVREAISGFDGYKPPHTMAFASYLKSDQPALYASMQPKELVAAYKNWLKDNADVGSRTSGGSKASKPKAKKAEDMTEEELEAKKVTDAARYKAAAEKRKATMAANKAAQAKPEEPVKPAVVEAKPTKPKPAKKAKPAVAVDYNQAGGADFTYGGVTYTRMGLNIFNKSTMDFVGAWDEANQTIDEDAEAPEIELDDE